MSGAGEVICEGWLRKSPPEKKLRRYAWKRRWFVLRSGRLSGEPDVLQYYKNQQSRRPIRTINLHLCEQLESSFVFDLRTEERVWYLVSESEEDMNRWVPPLGSSTSLEPDDFPPPSSSSSSSSSPSLLPNGLPPSSSSPSCSSSSSPFVTSELQRHLISGSLSDRASMFEFSESFNSYFMNKGLVPLGSEDNDVDENYVPMSAAPTEPPVSWRLWADRCPPRLTWASEIPPSPRSPPSPLLPLSGGTPPREERPAPPHPPQPETTAQRSESVCREDGQSVSCRAPTQNQSEAGSSGPPSAAGLAGSPAPRPLTCHSNLHTRSLHSPPPQTPSAHSSSPPSSDSDEPDENYVAMTTTSSLSSSTGETTLRLMLHRSSEVGVSNSSVLRRAGGDKQVEYLDLDLNTGRACAARQKRCTAEGGSDQSVSGEERARGGCAQGGRARVDYVVVDPKRTKALRSTREAWHDGRMSTEKEKC
ncbi:hypothetical protein F7725_004933 [Dissostichus mawsoni]|uniref:PH domain-containing protein n=1 Tax=Dissostichus mawsoni TaxID=36200 RepID=A0A7J5XLP7_DISMA|nr:hypothetical protein F7725_004933 [Dissostichus mawsoni]